MTDIIVKDIKNGSEYYYGWSADVAAEDVSYDNTTSGLSATTLQDAIDEIQTQVIKQQMQITSNVVLWKVTNACEVPWYFVSKEIGSPMSLYTTSWTYVVWYSADSDTSFTYKNFFYWKGYTAGHSDHLYIYNINTWTVTYSIDNESIYWTKVNWDNFYIRLNSSYLKWNLDWSELEAITSTEYNEVKDYTWSYKWLFYSSDWQDIVAMDWDNVEVKRYHNVWSFSWIANDIIYRIVWDVSYAIATI